MEITAELVRRLLDYDPETGKLFWRERTPEMFKGTMKKSAEAECRRWNARHALKETGNPHPDGYIQVCVNSKAYLAHRIIWLLHTGEWPKGDLDHRNRIRTDNRIENLRLATRKDNGGNCNKASGTSSRFKGVTWDKHNRKWIAQIRADRRIAYLGSFLDEIDAARAYDRAALDHFGEFACINFPDNPSQSCVPELARAA